MAGAGIANWQSYYGENDIDQWMIPFFGASVYDDPAVYARSSPITFIKNVKTPTLVAGRRARRRMSRRRSHSSSGTPSRPSASKHNSSSIPTKATASRKRNISATSRSGWWDGSTSICDPQMTQIDADNLGTIKIEMISIYVSFASSADQLSRPTENTSALANVESINMDRAHSANPLRLFSVGAIAYAAIAILLVRSQVYAAHPDVLAWGLTFDLGISIPLIYWFLFVRTGVMRPMTLIPLFVIAVGVASRIVPAGQHHFAQQLGYVAAPLDLVTLWMVARRVMRARSAAAEDGDVPHGSRRSRASCSGTAPWQASSRSKSARSTTASSAGESLPRPDSASTSAAAGTQCSPASSYCWPRNRSAFIS